MKSDLTLKVGCISLGSAQFGNAYGVTNRGGQVSDTELDQILLHACTHGIRTIDTASTYGNCEYRLGLRNLAGWEIGSKVQSPPNEYEEYRYEGWLRAQVESSIFRLSANKIDSILFHREEDLLGSLGDRRYRALKKCKEEGLVNSIGVSVYSSQTALKLCQRYDLDIVQVPYNLFDQRLVLSGDIWKIRSLNTRIHVRSVFLQGILLRHYSGLPEYFQKWKAVFSRYEEWKSLYELSYLQACLSFVLCNPMIEKVVIGVDCVKQLDEIIACCLSLPEESINYELVKCEDEQLFNPLCWVLS